MINSKFEKILLVIVWYVLLIIFRFILPISEPPTNIDKYVVVFLSTMVTVIIYRVYIYHRDKRILKNINHLLEANQIEEAIKYIDKWLAKQKKCRSVYMYKLYVMAMCGRITEFEQMLSECERTNKYRKLITLDFVEALRVIINYFKTCNCMVVSLKQQYWAEIMDVLSEKDHKKNIPILLSMYSRTKFKMIKSVLAFKLYLTYLSINNNEKAEFYYNEALKYAPSLEIAYYIENTGDGPLCSNENLK